MRLAPSMVNEHFTTDTSIVNKETMALLWMWLSLKFDGFLNNVILSRQIYGVVLFRSWFPAVLLEG